MEQDGGGDELYKQLGRDIPKICFNCMSTIEEKIRGGDRINLDYNNDCLTACLHINQRDLPSF